MSNMSYCRFQNTLQDLRDCQQALQMDGMGDLSKEELSAAKSLIGICSGIAEEFGEELDMDEEVDD